MSQVNIRVIVGRKPVDVPVEAMKMVNKVNQIPYVELTLSQDSSVFQADFPIEIEFDNQVFIGQIQEKLKVFSQKRVYYKIRLGHPAQDMTRKRTSRVFKFANESDVLKKTFEGTYKNAGEGEGLIFDTSAMVTEEKALEQLVQHDCTDWDFLLCRAEAHGLVVVIEGLTVRLVDLAVVSEGPGRVLKDCDISQVSIRGLYRQGISEINTQMHNHADSATPLKGESNVWDFSDNVDHDLIPKASVLNQRRFSGVYGNNSEVQAWANGIIKRNIFAQVQGCVKLSTAKSVLLLSKVEIQGIAELNTSTLITGIEIQIKAATVTTCLHFGLSEVGFADKHRIHSPPAANLLPGINGLQIGRVEKIAKDPGLLDRVQVSLPNLGSENPVIWARCAFPYAGEGRGVFFPPQVKDEVLVGFLNDDPRHAVVLGVLYANKVKAPEGFAVNNNKAFGSGLVIKPGLSLQFSGESDKEVVVLQTPEKGGQANRLTISNVKQEGFTLVDRHNNEWMSNKDGISITSSEGNSITMDKKQIIIAKGKSLLTLNDNNTILKVGDNTFTLGKNGLEIKVGENVLTLSNSGISLNSNSEIKINTNNKVTVKGDGGIALNP